MNPLRLSPLPTTRAEDQSKALQMEREGFVDEAAITAIMWGGETTTRVVAYPQDLALAADDLDFAGWKLPATPAPRAPLFSETKAVPEIALRRPAAPVIEEPGLGTPHSGSHRWWLAGLAGVLSTLLFSLLLLNLSIRGDTTLEVFFAPRPAAPANPLQQNQGAQKESPELTDISVARP